jgi:hypothetical protein
MLAVGGLASEIIGMRCMCSLHMRCISLGEGATMNMTQTMFARVRQIKPLIEVRCGAATDGADKPTACTRRRRRGWMSSIAG